MKKLTTKEFIQKAIFVHGIKYDYSKVEYISSKYKVKIMCTEHGEFEQIASAHLFGIGCDNCAGKANLTQKDFIKRAKKIHGNKYNYSKSIFINTKSKLEIKCFVHGIFLQSPECHMRGYGCPNCAGKNITTEEFIKKSKEIFSEEYDYSLVKYSNSLSKIKIICYKHGVFIKTPKKHLAGQGCQKCSMSSGEKRVLKILNKYNVKSNSQHKFNDCLSSITNVKLKFDFYLKKYNTCIEYNGLQHYFPIKHFGGKNKFNLCKKMDYTKEVYCKNKNIPLIIIFKENENIPKYRFVDLHENSSLKLKNILSNDLLEMNLTEYINFKNKF